MAQVESSLSQSLGSLSAMNTSFGDLQKAASLRSMENTSTSEMEIEERLKRSLSGWQWSPESDGRMVATIMALPVGLVLSFKIEMQSDMYLFFRFHMLDSMSSARVYMIFLAKSCVTVLSNRLIYPATAFEVC
jgi:hypothetical protein